jgi:lipid-A-disaccharide synthase
MVGAIDRLRKIYDFNYSVLATEDTAPAIERYLKNRCAGPISVIVDPEEKRNVLKKSLVAIAKSGTNTLEIAASSVPMIIVYRFNFLTNIVASLFMKIKSGIKYINLINIIANREIVPELTLYNCTVDNIVKRVISLLDNEEAMITQVRDSLAILRILGYGADNSPSRVMADEIRRSFGL